MAVEFNQTAFRFRNDDGDHTTATWKAATNTNISVNVASGNVKLRVRMAAQEDGTTAATFAANLFMSRNGGAYAQVGSATANVKAVDSTNLTDNATTTQQISSFTYVNGRVDDVDGTTTSTASIVQNSGTEFEFMIELIAADLAHNDTLDFRLYRSSVAITTYTQTPRITIIKSQSVAAGQTTETDTSQPVARVKAKTIGQNNVEADLSQAVSRIKQRTTGLSAETDAAQPITARKALPVSQILESSSAQPISARKSAAVNQALEGDLAQAIARRKTIVVLQVTETDLAQSLFGSKRVAVVQAVETDLAQSIVEAGPIFVLVGQALELDAVFGISTNVLRVIQVDSVAVMDVSLDSVAVVDLSISSRSVTVVSVDAEDVP